MSIDVLFNNQVRKAPRSSKTEMVFKFDKKTNEFSRKDFSPEATYHKVSLQDVIEVNNRLKQVPNYKIKSYDWMGCAIMVIGYGSLIGLLIWNSKRKNEDGSKKEDTLGTVLIVLALVVFYGALIGAGSCVKKVITKYLTKREKGFERTLAILNAERYTGIGCSWKTGKFGAWIILSMPYMAEVTDSGAQNVPQNHNNNFRAPAMPPQNQHVPPPTYNHQQFVQPTPPNFPPNPVNRFAPQAFNPVPQNMAQNTGPTFPLYPPPLEMRDYNPQGGSIPPIQNIDLQNQNNAKPMNYPVQNGY